MKLISTILTVSVAVTTLSADIAEEANAMLADVHEKTITYTTDSGWMYSRNELEHLSRGTLTDGRVIEVSKATKKENANPIPAIVDFHSQLNKLGITLLVVPVPPKLAVYPTGEIAVGEAAKNLQDFESELRAQGVEVIDITSDLITAADKNVYCKTDSHWSPAGIKIAVQKLAERMNINGNSNFTVSDQEVIIAGDLQKSLDNDTSPKESIKLEVITGELFSEDSPVLLLTDSHGLIFSSGGDMLAENAGLGEQLAAQLQIPVDRMSVKGSASTPVRVNLYRKAAKNPAWLKNKKFVIWVFTCREFTESTNGWAKVPVLKE